jgi:hypothetical protein
MRSRIGLCLLAVLLAACSDTTAPASAEPSGEYHLVSVDGHLLPYVYRTDSAGRHLIERDQMGFGFHRSLDQRALGRDIPPGEVTGVLWFTEAEFEATYEFASDGTISLYDIPAGHLVGRAQGNALIFADEQGRHWRYEPGLLLP